MNAAHQLLRTLSASGVQLSCRGNRLHVEAPSGTLTPPMRRSLTDQKSALLVALSETEAMRARLRTLADENGIDASAIATLSSGDLSQCSGLPEYALCSYLRMAAEDTRREAGDVPSDETARMLCARCGPVWTSPDVAAVLPRVDGWPRALGCPWCHLRRNGNAFSRPPVACGDCKHFLRDPVNPFAGAGTCSAGVQQDRMYPSALHPCAEFRPKPA